MAPNNAEVPDGPKAAPQSLRVLNADRRAPDLFGVSRREQVRMIEDLIETLGPKIPKGDQEILRTLPLVVDAVLDAARERPDPAAPAIIIWRQLLRRGDITPLVNPDDDGAIVVRPATRKQLTFLAPPPDLAGASPQTYDTAAGPDDAVSLAGVDVSGQLAGCAGDGRNKTSAVPTRHLLSNPAAAARLAVTLARCVIADTRFPRWMLPAPRGMDLAAAATALPASPAPPDETRLRLAGLVEAARAVSALGAHAGIAELIARGGSAAVAEWLRTGVADGPAVTAFLHALRQASDRARVQHAAARSAAAAITRARQLLAIVGEKLGDARREQLLRALRDRAAAADDPVAVAAALTTRERELVETELTARERTHAGQLSNKCPHVALVRRLRAAGADDEARVMKSLRGYLADPEGPSAPPHWIMCRMCQYQAICSHVPVLVALRARNAPYPDRIKALRPFMSKIPVAGSVSFYCRVCGEQLATQAGILTSVAAELGAAGHDGDDARRQLWTLAIRLAEPPGRAQRLLRFVRPVDPRRFAGEAADACRPLLVLASSKKPLARTSQDRPDDRGLAPPPERLEQYIYLYAFIMTIVAGNRALPPGEVALELEGVRPNAAPAAYADRLLRHLVETQASLLGELEGVTDAQIANQFRVAYAALLRARGRGGIAPANAAAVFAQSVLSDPLFRAAAQAQRVLRVSKTAATKKGGGAKKSAAGAKKRGAAAKNTPAAARERFRSVVGVDFDAALTWQAPDGFGAFCRGVLHGGSVSFPAGADPKWAYRLPEISLFRNMWGAAALRGAGALVPIKPGKTEASAEFARGMEALVVYSTMSNDEEKAAYEARLARAAPLDAAAEREREIRASFPYAQLPHLQTAAVPKTPAGPSAVFDERGRPHQWTVFVWSDGLELTRPELMERIAAARQAGEASPLAGLELTDRRCPTCNVLRSETARMDTAKVIEARDLIALRSALETYYESRCPEGDVHTLKNGACTKCGRDPDAPVTPAYATKYREAFEKAMARPALKREARKDPAFALPPPARKVRPKFDAEALQRAHEMLVTAKHLGTVAELEAIGSAYGRTLDDVRAGVGAQPPEAADDPRPLMADAAVRRVVFAYSQRRNSLRSRGEGAALPPPPELLPPGYFAQSAALRAAGQSADALRVAVEALCAFCAAVAGLADMSTFGLDLLRQALLSESRFTVAGEFRKSIFGNLDAVAGVNDTSMDDLASAEVGDVGEDVVKARAPGVMSAADSMDIDPELAGNLEN